MVSPPLALEVDAGGVEEDELEFGEQITPVGEQPLFDQVLGAPRGERCLIGLLGAGQFLPQPRYGPVEMVELQRFTSFYLILFLPLIRGPIGAGVEEAVEDSPVNGATKSAVEWLPRVLPRSGPDA